MHTVYEEFRKNLNDDFTIFVNQLTEFVSIPSISNSELMENQNGISKAVAWLTKYLADMGMHTIKTLSIPGSKPIVFAHWECGITNAPTILLYAHYDVQPVDISLWNTPPFTPTIRGGRIFARGVSDNKAPLLVHLFVLSNLIHQEKLAVNVKILIEGEEEARQKNLKQILLENADLFSADFALSSDSLIISVKKPCVVISQRGLLTLDIIAVNPILNDDLSTSEADGYIVNPLEHISEITNKCLHQVNQISSEPTKSTTWKALQSEANKITAYCTDIRHSGRSENYIPKSASATLNIRFPHLYSSEEIEKIIRNTVNKIVVDGLETGMVIRQITEPIKIQESKPYVKLLAEAYSYVFDCSTPFVGVRNKINASAILSEVLNLDNVLMGFGTIDDNIHLPNENITIEMLHKSMSVVLHYYLNISNIYKSHVDQKD